MEKTNLIPNPIDNKNLMEDPFEDSSELFGDFGAAKDHRKNGKRHLIGMCEVPDEDFPRCVNASGYVDASWSYGGYTVTIKLLAVSPTEDFDETKKEIFDYYKKVFKSWECEENLGLVVKFEEESDMLYVSFYTDLDQC